MWNGKKKAVTFSYDDGVEQDVRFIELLDRYGLRGTFNLNLGLQSPENTFQKSGVLVCRIGRADIASVYKDHEIAGHTMTHARLDALPDAAVREEIRACQDGLRQLTGRDVAGMAYPYGAYSDRAVEIARELGVRYARTTAQTEAFGLPRDLLRLETTCRHANPRTAELARAFVASEPDRPQLFFLWGHTYEFDEFDAWGEIEEICQILAGRGDVFYGTNAEVLLDA